jgi:putative ABC transport system ATP-binding protein
MKLAKVNGTHSALVERTVVTVLEARKVSKQVSSPEGVLTILHDISIAMNRGDSIAVVGASGAGKSTLLAILAGLDTPSSGQVWLDGQEITGLDEDGRAAVRSRSVGFVFQAFHLVQSLTALENVMLPLELTAVLGAKDKARAALVAVGLGARADHYPSQLSGGEQQRVAIARAFVNKPVILFADEPTGNLDSATGAKIADLLFSLNEAANTTLVLVTHDRSLAQRCKRLIELDSGCLLSDSGLP